MTVKYACVQGGIVTGFGVAQDENCATLSGSQGGASVIIYTGADPVGCYYKGGQFHPLPDPPGPWAEFDVEADEWRDNRTAEAKRQWMAARIKARRDVAIAGGTSASGIAFATDEASQGRITGAALSALLDPAYSARWKLPGGVFVTLTAPEVIAAAQAVRAHVQACFDREAELLSALDAGLPVDPDDGWP